MGAADAEEETTLRRWLERFELLEIDQPVAERAIELRRENRVRLPDAIIRATAQIHGRVLVSRDVRDFPSNTPGIHVPYEV